MCSLGIPYEVPGVDPDYIQHRLNVDPHCKPVQQKVRRVAPIHAEAVQKEVVRLLQARAIREQQYPTWLSNTVVVKKKNGKWRVCVDFTNLNQVCPKDPIPLPKIDQLVDAIAGHNRMSFLDAFQGYHQIALSTEDHEKTAFITPLGVFPHFLYRQLCRVVFSKHFL
uniref:Reverse transcriptase domain-containing protein n=1 Tax=Fagus sylvatica TaxID=28930 RepID=A0A2N9GIW6_FAGSY